MANKELLETIRKEIINRIDKRHLSAQAKNELISLLHFLNAIETEKPMNPDDAMKELDEKIALVKQRGTWDGVDVDKYMDEVRGREPEKPAPNDLEESAGKSAITTYKMPEDGDFEKANKTLEARVFHEIGFKAGAEWAMNRFEPATFGNTLGDTELFKKK